MKAKPYPETILVVDDNEFLSQALTDLLTSEGYRVSTARSAREAVDRYSRELPDLVTLDLVMPGTDGLAALAALREADPAAKVIVVSGVGLEEKVVEAIRMGARNYLSKPFERDKVLETTRRVLDDY